MGMMDGWDSTGDSLVLLSFFKEAFWRAVVECRMMSRRLMKTFLVMTEGAGGVKQITTSLLKQRLEQAK